MHEFKIGDRVRVIDPEPKYPVQRACVGKTGVVQAVLDSGTMYRVFFDYPREAYSLVIWMNELTFAGNGIERAVRILAESANGND